MNLYDTSALYNQNMSLSQQEKFIEFYKKVFAGYDIQTIHDCSIGAGGTTLPLAKLGYRISGSDLNESLLERAKVNFESEGFDLDVFTSDFRSLGETLPSTYDCIISTGNSLPHINNQEVADFVKTMSSKINDNGLLFMDMRNWDKNLAERPIFKAGDPFKMNAEEHASLYHIWNWHDDDSVDFVFATSIDQKGKHVETSLTYAPTYYPLRQEDYKKMLEDNGFKVVGYYDVDYIWMSSLEEKNKTADFHKDFEHIGWYAILAQKVK